MRPFNDDVAVDCQSREANGLLATNARLERVCVVERGEAGVKSLPRRSFTVAVRPSASTSAPGGPSTKFCPGMRSNLACRLSRTFTRTMALVPRVGLQQLTICGADGTHVRPRSAEAHALSVGGPRRRRTPGEPGATPPPTAHARARVVFNQQAVAVDARGGPGGCGVGLHQRRPCRRPEVLADLEVIDVPGAGRQQ